MKVVLKCVMVDYGVQSVLIHLVILMLKLPVDNLITVQLVCYLLVFLFFISSTGAVESNTFGKGAWSAHSLYFLCSGSEASLLTCTYYTSTCYYYYSYDTGIKCEGITII